jgi:C-terminal peptidase prc
VIVSSPTAQGFRLLVAILLLFSGLSCRLAARAWESLSFAATPTSSATATHTATAILPSPSPSPSPSPTGTPTQTPLPSPTASSTPTPTRAATQALPEPAISPTPLSTGLQLSIFEELWNIVNEEYLYEDFNGLDWDAVYVQYRRQIEAGLSNADFYAAMNEMIFSLGDEHSAYLTPDQVLEEDAEYAGDYDYVGIGILANPIPERRRAVILVVFPGSPAQEAGLKSHDSILSIGGEPILDEEGRLRNILRGPEGSLVSVMVQTPGEEPREIFLTRRRIQGPVPVPYTVLTTPGGKRVGYILLVTFADQTVDNQVGKALQLMSFDAPLDGVILDNRMNEGGADTVLSGTLAYFTQGELGSFVSRKEERPFRILNKDMLGSQEVPLVVLVGKDTVSFGEIFAGILQNTDRAYLVGETTLGNVEILWGYTFADGSRAWIAHDTFRPNNASEQDWEKTGIVPDLAVPVYWDEVTLDTDPAVKAALDYLDGTLLR